MTNLVAVGLGPLTSHVVVLLGVVVGLGLSPLTSYVVVMLSLVPVCVRVRV